MGRNPGTDPNRLSLFSQDIFTQEFLDPEREKCYHYVIAGAGTQEGIFSIE
jgi:hypothetical protein